MQGDESDQESVFANPHTISDAYDSNSDENIRDNKKDNKNNKNKNCNKNNNNNNVAKESKDYENQGLAGKEESRHEDKD